MSTQLAEMDEECVDEANEAFIADTEGHGPDLELLQYDQGWQDGYHRHANSNPGIPAYTDGWWDGRAESEARAEFHGPL